MVNGMAYSYTVAAVYPNATSAPSSAVAYNPLVPTITQISASPATVTSPNDAAILVTVTAPSATPTGSITFLVDGSPFPGPGSGGTWPLVNGSVSFTLPQPSVQLHTLTVSYPIQNGFNTSSDVETLLVAAAPPMPTITKITLNPLTVTSPNNASILVNVTAPSATSAAPTGSITLQVDGRPFPGPNSDGSWPLAGGSVTIPLPQPSVGTHTVSATYPAQNGFGTSSDVEFLAVLPSSFGTSTAVAAPSTIVPNGVTVNVTVSAFNGGTPTGQINLTVVNSLGTTTNTFSGTLNGGKISFTIPQPAADTYQLTATFTPQGSFSQSVGTGTVVVFSGVPNVRLNVPRPDKVGPGTRLDMPLAVLGWHAIRAERREG